MNAYIEMRKRHQAEVDKFPIGFAFTREQFERVMRSWGLEPEDTDKVVAVGPGFIRRTDEEAFHEMFERHDRELRDAIAADADGLGFIRDMFARELAEHEFGYTYELDDTLEALDYTMPEIEADERLKRGLDAALKPYYEE